MPRPTEGQRWQDEVRGPLEARYEHVKGFGSLLLAAGGDGEWRPWRVTLAVVTMVEC